MYCVRLSHFSSSVVSQGRKQHIDLDHCGGRNSGPQVAVATLLPPTFTLPCLFLMPTGYMSLHCEESSVLPPLSQDDLCFLDRCSRLAQTGLHSLPLLISKSCECSVLLYPCLQRYISAAVSFGTVASQPAGAASPPLCIFILSWVLGYSSSLGYSRKRLQLFQLRLTPHSS